MGKYVSVNVDKKNSHFTEDYLVKLKAHLSKTGLELTDEINLKSKSYLDYDAADLEDSWPDFVSKVIEKFPNITEEYEEGYTSDDVTGKANGYQEYSTLNA